MWEAQEGAEGGGVVTANRASKVFQVKDSWGEHKAKLVSRGEKKWGWQDDREGTCEAS